MCSNGACVTRVIYLYIVLKLCMCEGNLILYHVFKYVMKVTCLLFVLYVQMMYICTSIGKELVTCIQIAYAGICVMMITCLCSVLIWCVCVCM